MSEDDTELVALRQTFINDCCTSLLKRCDELDEVKQYIRQMNDVIKEDMFINMGSIGILMKQKVDEMSNLIKDMLKTQYGQIKAKENELREKIDRIKQETTNFKEANQQIDLVLNDLNDENQILYPKFTYSIKNLTQLEDAIKNLTIEIKENAFNLMNRDLFIEKFGLLTQINSNETFNCTITSGLSDTGLFWLQISNKKQQVNHLIDELNKQIRSMRINDATFETYSESKLTLSIGLKCFFKEKKTKKWLRGDIECVKPEIKIRCLDIGTLESNVQLENILPWRLFDLNLIDFQSIQCSILPDDTYTKRISYDTKFLFKDLTVGQLVKCTLVESNGIFWKAKLILDNGQVINEAILAKNDEQHEKSSFKSEDIRFKNTKQSDNSNITSNSSILNCLTTSHQDLDTEADLINEKSTDDHNTETNEILVKSSTSNLLDHNLLLNNNRDLGEFSAQVSAYIDKHFESQILPQVDVVYQSSICQINDSDPEPDDDRLQIPYQHEGICYVTSELSKTGMFWIKPHLEKEINYQIIEYQNIIKKFIETTLFKSYDDLHITPVVGKKCFVYLDKTHVHDERYVRGLIEEINEKNETCKVRLVDLGSFTTRTFDKVYPHRRLHELKYQPKAIRCCLTNNKSILYFQDAIKKFDEITASISVNYNLIERVNIDGFKCWLVELSTSNIQSINAYILNLQQKNSVNFKRSKSTILGERNQHYYKNRIRQRSKSADSKLEKVLEEPQVVIKNDLAVKIYQENKSDINNNKIEAQKKIVKTKSKQKHRTKKQNYDMCKTDGQKQYNYRNDDDDNNDPTDDNNKFYYNSNRGHRNSGFSNNNRSNRGSQRYSYNNNNRNNGSGNGTNCGGSGGYTKTNLINILCKYHTQSYLVACPEGDDDDDEQIYDENEEDYNEVFIDDDKFQLLSSYERILKTRNLSLIVSKLDKAVKKREEREQRIEHDLPDNVLKVLFEEPQEKQQKQGQVNHHIYEVQPQYIIKETRQSNLEDTLHDMSDVFYDPSLQVDFKQQQQRHKYVEIRSDHTHEESNQTSPSIMPSIHKSIRTQSLKSQFTTQQQQKDIKNFTVAVFVDSIEANSGNSNSESTTSNSNNNEDNHYHHQIIPNEFDINHLKVLNELTQLRRNSEDAQLVNETSNLNQINCDTNSLKEFEFFEHHIQIQESQNSTHTNTHFNKQQQHNNLSTITECSNESGSGATIKKSQSLLKKAVIKSSQSTSTSNKQVKNEVYIYPKF